jgi:hypothetical protein
LGSALVAAALDDDDGVGGRAADGPGLVVELDRERVLGHVDGDDAAGVAADFRRASDFLCRRLGDVNGGFGRVDV